MTSEGRMQKFHTDDLGSTSDLLKQISLAGRLIKSALSTTQSEQWHVIIMEFLRSSLRRHFVEDQWLHRIMLAVFLG